MMDLIEQSTAAYDQREELCNKLQLLKDKTQSDKLAHVQVILLTIAEDEAMNHNHISLVIYLSGNEGVAEETGSRREAAALFGCQGPAPCEHRVGGTREQ